VSSPRPRLRLGTRGSPLALWQARDVAARLGALGVGVETLTLRTSGDKDVSRPIDDLDSEAPFADALEQALRREEIDLAVHSLKDLPLTGPDDLVVAAVAARGPSSESLVSKAGARFDELRRGALVGTSCARRAAQIRRLRPELQPVPIRGAVEQRVRQVREGEYDAAILATAGLQRLGLEHLIAETFATAHFVPAPGQGALAVQVRAADERVRGIVAKLDDARLRSATRAELLLQRAFEPSDTLTLAALAECEGDGDGLVLFARLLRGDAGEAYDVRVKGAGAEQVATTAVQRLRKALEQGAAA